MRKIRDLGKKIMEWGKYHMVDTTAAISLTNPVYGFLETQFYGMSHETSLRARAMITGIAYGGMGFIYSKGRDLSRKIFDITEETRTRVQNVHDALYTMGFSAALSSIIYTSAGTRNWKETATGILANLAMALPMGVCAGYAIDTARDLTGLKESRRVPRFLRNQSPKVKKTIAAGLIGASLGLMGLIYSSTPDQPSMQQSSPQQIEQKVLLLESILEQNAKQE